MPDIALPLDINKAAADISNTLKDGAYVVIGLGVLWFQRAQVQRVELTKQLEGWLGQLSDWPAALNSQVEGLGDTTRVRAETARTQVAQLAKALDERVQPVRQQFDEQFDRVEQYLPSSARSLAQSVRAAAADPEQRLRNAVGLD